MASQEEFDAMDAMEERVDAAIRVSENNDKDGFVNKLKRGPIENHVIYSACEYDEDDMPIDNLDEIPHKGTFTVVGQYDGFWERGGKGCEYNSDPITDPTWLQLTVLANEAIHVTKDMHHVFFENVNKEGDILYLSFGS